MSKTFVRSRFDGAGLPQAPLTPTLTTVLRRALREHSKTLRVCLPARVEQVLGDYRVNLLPLALERHGQSATPTTMPILPSVPVAMPHGAKFSVRYPLSVGDTGYVLIADRSLDTWLAGSGGPTDPADARLHDLTDAIFVPGLLTNAGAAAIADGSSDVVLRAGAATIRLQQAGHIVLGNGASELVALVQQLANQLASLSAFLGTAVCPPGGNLVAPAPGTTPAAPTGVTATVTKAAQSVAAAVGTLKGN